MKISIIQMNIEWLNPLLNTSRAEAFIARAKEQGADMVILPEMFATGFCMDSARVAELSQGVVEWMKSTSLKYNVTIGGGVAAEQGGDYYNRFYIVTRDGELHHYDKRHLFSYAREDEHYTSGNKRVVITINGVRILLTICYDIRFPVWCRNVGDYDVMLSIASWPASRRGAWDALLLARSIENQCYVCGVNRVGADPSAQYSGGSVVIDYRGRKLTHVTDNEEGIVTVDIDIDTLNEFREKFPALNDSDDFVIMG